MEKLKIISLVLSLLIFLQSCATIKEGFSSQKKNSTDEFLVEKKSPLVMPPEFNELPTPQINNSEDIFANEDSSNKIEKLISDNDTKIDNTIEQNKNFENLIIDQIKNN